jgi:hypothetical protein
MKSFFEFCQLLKKEQITPTGVAPVATPTKPVDPTKLIPDTFVKDLQTQAKKTGNKNVEAEVKSFILNMQKKGYQSIGSVKAQ